MKNFAKFSLPLFIFILFSFQFPLIAKAETSIPRASAVALKQARKDALTDAKVKACEMRQENIVNRSDQLAKRAANMEDVFSKIATRVEEFYQSKVVASGRTVANYNVLVADVSAKKDAVSPLLEKVATDAASFSCDKDRPAEQVKAFNQDMKAVISALEVYRKSVRNLIVAVKSVTGVENSATNSAKIETAQ
jgi:hypothetical protein